MQVRQPTFAGSWYPDTAEACQREIDQFMRERPLPDSVPALPLGGVLPHAGWYYSGSVACQVLAALGTGPAPDGLVIFGRHMHPGETPVLMDHGAWATPLGDLPIDEDLAAYLIERFAFSVESPRTPNRDNTIELQLPFIRHFFGAVPILPIGVPPSSEALRIADAVAAYAREKDRRLRVVGSTDLTHYGPNYGYTGHGSGAQAVAWVREENDRRLIEAVLALAPGRVVDEGLRRGNACCAGAAAAAIQAAMGLGARQGQMLAYATSYDKSPGESFVGYAGILLA